MRIAQVTPLWIPVPPYTYGGTELVVSWLCDELIRRGHQVTLFATSDSKTPANLIPIWPQSLWRAKLKSPHAVFSLLYEKLISLQDQFDIIHDHCEFYTTPYSRFLKPPVVTTLHHPLTEETIILYKKFPNINYVAVSKNQRRSGPGINIVKTIYHGLPIEKYPFNPNPQNYLLWLSRIGPDKGIAEAIDIAKLSGEKLIISGNILPQYADYFKFRIKPLIDGKQIQFVGASDFAKKVELFKNAKAFIFPVKRPEPFGLVVIEAMACGTPVIAFKEGSLPELIEDGKTGFLVSSVEEACQSLKKIDKISRGYCREYVEKNFNLKRMVNRYEKLYKKIMKNK
ncbi:MAG: glycosyltransferase family 4 protein [Patescibacteria group bacterium]|nr:glycosyltransferase family 4 protein [Patescibacteria group bacterium]